MKYLTPLLVLLIISFSCGNKQHHIENKNELKYSIDSIKIDQQGRILDIRRGIENSDLDAKNKSLFLYNGFDHSIDEVDLDCLKIVNNYPFEEEGPNGTGTYVNSIELLNDSLIFIKSFGKSAVFQKDGHLIERIDWENSKDSNGLKYLGLPKFELALFSEQLIIFGLSYNESERDVFLDILSFSKNKFIRFNIDTKKSYRNFVLTIDDPLDYTYLDPLVYMMHENNLVMVSHEFSNEVYLFNTNGDHYKTINYEPKMTAKRAKDLSGKSIASSQQLKKEYQYLVEQVRFGPPVWDKVKERYLRLSASRTFSDVMTEENSFLPEVNEVKVYISVFDEDFNLISEVHIPELTTEFVKYFAIDGKLWVYQNFSDELGFLVLDI